MSSPTLDHATRDKNVTVSVASIAQASLIALMRSVGDVPFGRIIFDPWPGTATEQDLLTFVERDKRLCELIDGTLVEKPVGSWESLIARRLSTWLGQWVDSRRLGVVYGADATLKMRGGRVRLPDVTFVARASLPGGRVPREPIPTLPPTLAVEVLSRTNSRAEINQKLREYFESGCRLAWIIDPPTQTCEVYLAPGEPTHRLTAADDLDGGDVLPGFAVRLGELFADL